MERHHEWKRQVLGPSRAILMMQVFAGLPKATDGDLHMEPGLAAINRHNPVPGGEWHWQHYVSIGSRATMLCLLQ